MHFAHLGGRLCLWFIGWVSFCLKAIYIVSNIFLVNIPLPFNFVDDGISEIFKVLYSPVSLEFLLKILP